jgi:hypothetical protein
MPARPRDGTTCNGHRTQCIPRSYERATSDSCARRFRANMPAFHAKPRVRECIQSCGAFLLSHDVGSSPVGSVVASASRPARTIIVAHFAEASAPGSSASAQTMGARSEIDRIAATCVVHAPVAI